MTEVISIQYKFQDREYITYRWLTPQEKTTNQITEIYYVNVMPKDALSSYYISKKTAYTKSHKYKLWGFKNEFLKSYRYIIENKISHTTLEANPIDCPKCKKRVENIDRYELFVVYNQEYGRFCWGTLLWHLVLEHNYKPPRFFIEYIYSEYIRAIYGFPITIIKLDENSLKHFDIISRTGYENKIDYVNDKFIYENGKHNIEFMGDIITQCNDFDGQMPGVKSRIKNICIFFGKAIIKNDNEIRIEEEETEYYKEVVNYIYYVHPYNSQATENIDYYNNFKIDIPKFDDYKSFVSLMGTYTNLLGLILFANEGIYVISKLTNNSVIPDLNQNFNHEEYARIYDFIDIDYQTFVNNYIIKLNVPQLSENQKIHCYEYYQYAGSWNKKINEIVNNYEIKVSYFPKVPVNKSNNIYHVDHFELIYDTLYLPLNLNNCLKY